uniref:Pyruvate decarboxylase isozyme 3 n=1 Tax=Anthurium amnicola TaxID=1678845 RepID=A0A1D1Z9Y8_9ARAE
MFSKFLREGSNSSKALHMAYHGTIFVFRKMKVVWGELRQDPNLTQTTSKYPDPPRAPPETSTLVSTQLLRRRPGFVAGSALGRCCCTGVGRTHLIPLPPTESISLQ